jgi:aspartyl-tRNA(Asn)/glutamyl-tRNA(Gln) amidotransferase subunit A
MKELAFASIKTLTEKLTKKEISPEELLDLTIVRCKKYDLKLKSLLELFDQESILKELEKNKVGKLYGICGAVKDVICQQERITSCASKILENFHSPYNATTIARLKEEGAFCIGRANCDEFAMGSSTETSAFQKTANPWDLTRVPGGSSGGSAAAVAAGLVPWALGSETGGSIRLPACWCNVVGLKPTYGLVSRYGLIAYASSLDQIGPITRNVYDNAFVLSCIAGNDKNDSTTQNISKTDYTKDLTGKIKPGLKIGIIDNAIEAEGFDPEVKKIMDEALEQFKKLGAELVHLKLPLMDFGAAIYFIVSRAEAASNLARFDGVRYGFRDKDVDTLSEMYEKTRAKGFGRVVKQRILIGNYVLSVGHADEYYNVAKKVQALLRAQFLEAFKSVDVLFSPVSPIPAFKFGEVATYSLAMDLLDYLTAPVNLAGIPSLSIPGGFTKSGLPIGFQLIGPDLSETLLYQTGYAYERNTPWHTMYPPLFNE